MSKVRNCAIIGAGLGGLSLARLLPPSWNVVVFDKQTPPQTTPPHAPPPLNDRALGIWPAGWNVLQHALPSESFLTLESLSTNLPPAAYRNSSGVWLSKAPEGAPERVFAARESDIRSALSEGVDVRWESQIGGITTGEEGVEIQVIGEKWKEESGGVFDLVVGADGPSSIVRKSCVGGGPFFVGTASAAGWVSAEDVNALGLKDVPPFEVLSSGRRFAFVPAGGHGAASFFATILLDEVVLVKNHNKKIETHFESFFSPIPEILQRSINPFRWDYHFQHRKPLYSSSKKIALIGDAANTQGPNLAQGGAVALEDAYVLANVLKKEERGEIGLEKALNIYQEKRRKRAKRLNRVTKFTALLAHEFLDERRDLMAKVPQPLNGWVFRAALKHSLGPKIF